MSGALYEEPAQIFAKTPFTEWGTIYEDPESLNRNPPRHLPKLQLMGLMGAFNYSSHGSGPPLDS